jgi:hypothetical protein
MGSPVLRHFVTTFASARAGDRHGLMAADHGGNHADTIRGVLAEQRIQHR